MTDRTITIGGSEVGAVLGLSPFSTPLDVWRSKVLKERDDAESDAMRLGNVLQADLLHAYAESLPAGSDLNVIVPTMRKDWRRASLDGIATVAGWQRVVEAKVTSYEHDWGEPGTDDVPLHHQAQAQWYMDLAELDECDLPVLVLPTEPRALRDLLCLEPAALVRRVGVRVYRTTYSGPLARRMVERVTRFWCDNVLAEVPPPPVDLADARRCWWSVKGSSRPADDRITALLLRYDAVREARKIVDAEIARVQFDLHEAFGTSEELIGTNGPWATLKQIERKAYKVDATKFRQLRTTKWWDRAKVEMIGHAVPQQIETKAQLAEPQESST